MLERDYYEDLSQVVIRKEIIIEKEKKKKEDSLKRILVIGPDYPERCHFSENVYDLWKKRKGYEVKIMSDLKLPVSPINIEKRLPIPLSSITKMLGDWKPQLITIDQININFTNDQQAPVFYHHREFKRPPTVFYPTVVYFWHEDITQFYEKMFAREWMAQIRFKDVMYIPFNPNRYKPEEKKYFGVNGIGFRETLEDVVELTEVGPAILLDLEQQEFKTLEFKFFDTPITDEQYRDLLPKCEALWIPLSVRQYTSRRMIEAMGCKTLCILKLENKRHKEILEKMGFVNGSHYIGVSQLVDIREAFEKCKNKSQIIKNAYREVITHHNYKSRIDQMIKKYEMIQNKNK